MSYQVLARKWRPKRFQDVIGQSHVTRSLQNALSRDRLGHAYILTGTRGIGKTSVARIFAKAIRCEQRAEDSNPCGVCPSCEDFDSASSMNVVEIDGASNNSVDDVIPPIAQLPDLPNFGELVGERIPDSYNLKRSGSTTSAGLGVVWPIYTAGRTDALTGVSEARTLEALADSTLDKNALYNTLIERYFKAQLAIIAAYLREDAYDTLQQTDHMAERLFEEGFISRVDRLEAQSALADAKSESINA